MMSVNSVLRAPFCVCFFVLLVVSQFTAQDKTNTGNPGNTRYADQFAGSDIGAKINAAIADCPAGPAVPVGCAVVIAAGNYSYSNTIVVNKCDIHLAGAGFRATTLNYTGSKDGLDVVSAPGKAQCVNGIAHARTGVILEGISLFSSSPAAASAIQLGDTSGGADYVHIRDVWISVNRSASWQNGIKFVNSENVLIDGGTTVHANAGDGIKNLITMDSNSRGDTFVGVNLTGKANGGTVNGLQTTGDGAELFWYGGVVQGGFTGAMFNCANCGGGIFGAHLELTTGNGDGVLYDNSKYGFTLEGLNVTMIGSGEGVRIGPSAAAWDFSVHGGSYTSITVASQAHNTQLYPNQVSKAIVNLGVNTAIGQYRIVGKSTPEFLVLQSTTFAALGTAPDGSVAYCSNCSLTNPCAASGTGALAKRINGKWVCN